MERMDKVAAALERLEESGLPASFYAPPMHRVLWGLGLPVPPPHFCGFLTNLVYSSLGFGLLFACLMWVASSLGESKSPTELVTETVIMGLLFGALMATVYRSGAKGKGIPRWGDFQPSAEDAQTPTRSEDAGRTP